MWRPQNKIRWDSKVHKWSCKKVRIDQIIKSLKSKKFNRIEQKNQILKG